MSAGTQRRIDVLIDAELERFRADPKPGTHEDVEALLESRGKTFSDNDVLEMLRSINEYGSMWKKVLEHKAH